MAATSHSAEGLNDMTYNRCVGTRYCSNNCPYKVRRFNFLHYADCDTPELKLRAQPRRHRAQRAASWRSAPTACSASTARAGSRRCRSRADPRRRDRHRLPGGLPDRGDRLRQHQRSGRAAWRSCKADAHNYGVLAELNTRPRTTYLAAIKNPNPAIGPERLHDGHESRARAAESAASRLSNEQQQALIADTRPWRNRPTDQPARRRGSPAATRAGVHRAGAGAGHNLSSVTDKISTIVLRPGVQIGWLIGFVIAFGGMSMFLFAITCW